ncbi:hypothetical protein ACNHUS_34685 [Actinomycetes bacterium M1A6_2h]
MTRPQSVGPGSVGADPASVERGRIVDDFGVVLSADAAGRTWAPARRWAVALDSGRLVFADTADLAPLRS